MSGGRLRGSSARRNERFAGTPEAASSFCSTSNSRPNPRQIRKHRLVSSRPGTPERLLSFFGTNGGPHSNHQHDLERFYAARANSLTIELEGASHPV
jgi:hypothetical protein